MKKIFATIIFAFSAATLTIAQSNTQALIPYPNSIEQCSNGKTFTISNATTIKSTLPDDAFVISELRRIIHKRLAITPATSDSKHNKNIISIETDSTIQGREHYTLEVNKTAYS